MQSCSFPYRRFFVDGSAGYMEEAGIIKSDYDRDVKRIMRQYGIRHEVELVSGYILKFTSKQYTRETKLFDLRNEITHAYRIIQDRLVQSTLLVTLLMAVFLRRYLALFWQEFYQSTAESEEETVEWSKISKKITWKNQLDVFEYQPSSSSSEEVKQKASAWFRVTYNHGWHT